MKNSGENHSKEQHAKHADHRHAFTNPAELASKWNDPQRDQWQYPDEIVTALGIKPGATVVDLGAGTGYMVAHLSKAVGSKGTVIALDTEAAMVEYLNQRRDTMGPATIRARKVNSDEPELHPASVDAVLTLDVWHHVASRQELAQKVYAGLKPGGRFVVIDHEPAASSGPPSTMRIEPEKVAEQLRSVGFRAELSEESMPRHYMVIGYKD